MCSQTAILYPKVLRKMSRVRYLHFLRWGGSRPCLVLLIWFVLPIYLPIFTFLSYQGIKIQGGATFSWPIWFHAATPGNFSLYLSLYYEMESTTDIPYRTLRMHYNVEVNWQYFIGFYVYYLPYCTCTVYSIWNHVLRTSIAPVASRGTSFLQ